ncbi:MAG: DUF4491 family protein [Candidatus Paceibacterota bacterium]
MNFIGIVIAVVAIVAIGLGHVWVPAVYKALGLRSWILALIAGLALTGASLFVSNVLVSTTLAVFAASFLWGIKELFEMDKKKRRG